MNRIVRLLKSTTVIVVVLTLLSKVTGFVREQVLAIFFGASEDADIFVTVLSIPQYTTNIVGGVFLACLVPIYIGVKSKDGKEIANQFALSIFVLTLGLILAISLIMYASMEQLSQLFFDNYSNSLRVYLLTALPIQAIMVISVLFQSFLNANKKFNIPIISTVLMNVVFILLIAFFSSSVSTLLWASFLSALVQVLILIIIMLKEDLIKVKQFAIHREYIKELVLMGIPMIIGTLFVQAYLIYDKILARDLSEGSIAALNYSFKIAQLPVGIIAMGVSTVLLSSLATLIANKNHNSANLILFKALKSSYIILLPMCLIMYVFAENITSILFERGAFGEEATILTSEALKGYTLGVLGLSLTMIMSRVFYASKNTIIPVTANIIAAICNLILAVILVRYFSHVGLAWANSISSVINFLILLTIFLAKNRRSLFSSFEPISIYKLIIITIGSLILFGFMNSLVVENSDIISFVLITFLGLMIYSVTCFLLYRKVFKSN